MRALFTSTTIFAFLLGFAASSARGEGPAAPAEAPRLDPSRVLDDYVKRAQPAYGWTLEGTETNGESRVLRVQLTSQVWQGLTWKHRLNVVVPPAAQGERARPGHALLLLTGSGREQQTLLFVSAIAARLGVPVAILHDVPNQPLLPPGEETPRGLREDALIAYTFQRFASSGDADWPALLPMTRAAIAAMDALGELSANLATEDASWRFGKLERFVTTGGSKRGWTTWLSAVADPRVIGIAPIVFDNLNFEVQIALHFETWGKPSPSIHDYTERGLLAMLRTQRGRDLVRIVDPWAYRERLDLPKLVLIATNDTYWPLDAVNVYRGGLPGELFCHYVPNTGHSAGLSVIPAVAGFFDHVTGRIPSIPDVRLAVSPRQGATIHVEANGAERVRAVRLWGTRIDGRDFTRAAWTTTSAQRSGAGWQAPLPEASQGETGRAAFIGEIQLDDSGGGGFTVHTPVQIWDLAPARE